MKSVDAWAPSRQDSKRLVQVRQYSIHDTDMDQEQNEDKEGKILLQEWMCYTFS